MNLRIAKYILALCICIGLSGLTALSQSNNFNQRDDKYRLLGLKRAKEAYEVARAE